VAKGERLLTTGSTVVSWEEKEKGRAVAIAAKGLSMVLERPHYEAERGRLRLQWVLPIPRESRNKGKKERRKAPVRAMEGARD